MNVMVKLFRSFLITIVLAGCTAVTIVLGYIAAASIYHQLQSTPFETVIGIIVFLVAWGLVYTQTNGIEEKGEVAP